LYIPTYTKPVATSRNQLRPKLVLTGLATEKDRERPVLNGSVRFLRVFLFTKTGLGPGPVVLGQKTGPDRTFNHYLSLVLSQTFDLRFPDTPTSANSRTTSLTGEGETHMFKPSPKPCILHVTPLLQ
jgi:hypothetical protein